MSDKASETTSTFFITFTWGNQRTEYIKMVRQADFNKELPFLVQIFTKNVTSSFVKNRRHPLSISYPDVDNPPTVKANLCT